MTEYAGLTRTVLVFGAGVSMPLGMPSGAGLVELIKKELDLSNGLLEQHDISKNIEYCGFDSIDSYVENNPEHASQIKPLIAKILFSFENEKLLFSKKFQLYHKIFDMVCDPNSTIRLTVINFNYDRSFEHFLVQTAFARKKAKTQSEARKYIMERISIISPYGTLGRLPAEDEKDCLPYGDGDTLTVLKNTELISDHCSKNINLFFENTSVNKLIHQSIDQANTIFFLGCGYHSQNINLLGLDGYKVVQKKLFGTSYKLNPDKISIVQKQKLNIHLIKSCTVDEVFIKYLDFNGMPLLRSQEIPFY